MKLAIVDDERGATDLLEKFIGRFGEENQKRMQVNIFHNPNDFLSGYSKDYDIVLMDVEMPGLNGIETAKELRRMDSRVVIMFITNMAQYALSGYEVEAVDYVLKPVSYADFSLKLKKALRYAHRNEDRKILLTTPERMIHVLVSDIYYIEVFRHYLEFHVTSGNYKVRGVMKEIEEELKDCHFSRCNHSYLVNLKYVEEIAGNTVRVAGETLPVSRNRRNEFLAAFTIYIGGMK